MKRLTILRHAKSSRDQPNLSDFDRTLNERGWKAARRMGRELTLRGFSFDLVLASMAARVRETLDGVREEFDITAEIRFEPDIYLSSHGVLLSLIRQLPDSVQSPLLVGHNPGLQQLVLDLTSDDEKDWRKRVAQKFPTAALAEIDLSIDRWAEAGLERGSISELILPRDLS